MYIYKINLIVEDDIENLETQNKIDGLIESIHKGLGEVNATLTSVQINDLSDNKNFGRCSNCGAWCSDFRENDPIRELPNGAALGNMWYCDLCLLEDHENHF